jgi:hypothetical protein
MSFEDDRVMSFGQWCELNCFSRKTGERIVAAGNGPKFIQLSERRKGVTVAENRRWQAARSRQSINKAADEVGWGIIRYLPGTGLTPQEDKCHFDGWYSDRADAYEIYIDWRKRYSARGWIVALVKGDEATFEAV